MKRRYVLILVSAVLLICLVLVVVLITFERKSRYERSCQTIQIGASKQQVVDSFGTPTEINKCAGQASDGPIAANCDEEYLYRSIFERWIISFDKEGLVINKSYGVLP